MTKKQKNIVSIIGFVLSLIICYQLAIKKTLEQKNEYSELELQSKFFENAPRQLSILKQKQHYYDSVMTSYQLNGSSIQNNLLSMVNEFADKNDLKVIEFLEPHITKKDDLKIKTYDFTFEGPYHSIIALVYKLEQKTKFGEIINLHFERKKNFRTGRDYLQARVLLRSIG